MASTKTHDEAAYGALAGTEQLYVVNAAGTVQGKTTTAAIAGLSPAGDVVGPASATDNALSRFDGTTGKLVQNSSATLSDAGNLTLAPTVNTSALTVTAFSLTGANAQSLADLAGTWNTSGTPTGIKLNVTNTASNATSKLLDLQVGGTSKAAIDLLGTLSFDNPATGTAPSRPGVGNWYGTLALFGATGTLAVTVSTGTFNFTSTYRIAWNDDVHIERASAGVLNFGNGTPGNTSATVKAGLIESTVTGVKFPDAVTQAKAATSGTYTPTLTNVANLGASTAYSCQYFRVGDVVTVSGMVDVDPTTPATSTQLGISLPVASDFANANECGGSAVCSTVANQSAGILGDVTNNRAEMKWVAGDVTNQPMHFTFSYRVI